MAASGSLTLYLVVLVCLRFGSFCDLYSQPLNAAAPHREPRKPLGGTRKPRRSRDSSGVKVVGTEKEVSKWGALAEPP